MAIPDLEEWLAASGLPPMDDQDDERCVRLVALVHRCVDWEVWGGPKTLRYWDALSERVVASCYAGPTVADWWTRMQRTMQLTEPHTKADRLAVAKIVAGGADRAVLDRLRRRASTYVLRVRCAVDQAKADRTNEEQP